MDASDTPLQHLAVACLLAAAPAFAQPLPSPDPIARPDAPVDARRPMANEFRSSVREGFSAALVGDMIIARPLTQAAPVTGFAEMLSIVRRADVAYGNLETSIIDIRTFSGAPHSFEGDWTNIALPAVAPDLKAMGFDLLGRANNHVADWGLEGMRETGRWLDEAGLAHAGTGETEGLARAPAYAETPRGRVALVSFATTFRPTSDAMAPRGGAPGRPGLSALHLSLKVHVTEDAMRKLAEAACALGSGPCNEASPAELSLAGTHYVRDTRNWNEWIPDPEDMAGILRAVRTARQHADYVMVAIHAHECAWDCALSGGKPLLPGAFLKDVARASIDAGADVFAATGIHNLGPIEIYRGRAIFYGLSNVFWSDIQEPVPEELFRQNRETLARSWEHPARATDYDLTMPLNVASFATQHTFQSVLATLHHGEGGALQRIELHPLWLGYGENLRRSGTPRLESDPERAKDTIAQIVARSREYGLAPLPLRFKGAVAVIAPGD